MTPHGVVTGRIVDEDGDPLPNAQVYLMRPSYNTGKRQLGISGGASSNDMGEYRIFNVTPGKYILSVKYVPPEGDRSIQPDEAYAPSYYPGTLDPANAVQLEVAPGAILRGIDMRPSKSRTVRVKGKVTQSGTAGPGPIAVHVTPLIANFRDLSGRIADSNGDYEMTGLAPGAYLVRAILLANGNTSTSTLRVEVGTRDLENVNLTLSPGVPITGHLRVEGQTSESLSGVQISLVTRSDSADLSGSYAAKLNADGSLHIADVSPGPYDVHVFPLPSGFYVKSIRSGDTDVRHDGIDVAGAPARLEIVLSPKAGQLTGTVKDPATGQPAADAQVVLIPRSPARGPLFDVYKVELSDHAGRFSFHNLAPGEYKVFAWEDIEMGAYMDPEFMKPVESKGEAVTIREGTDTSVQVQLIPAESPSKP